MNKWCRCVCKWYPQSVLHCYTRPISWSVPLQASCDELKNEATQVCCSHPDLVKYAINVTRAHTCIIFPAVDIEKEGPSVCVCVCIRVKRWHVVGRSAIGSRSWEDERLKNKTVWVIPGWERTKAGERKWGKRRQRKQVIFTTHTSLRSSRIKPYMTTRFNQHSSHFILFWWLATILRNT